MKIKYDPKVDAAYISFKEGHVEVTTMRITDDIAIDFGPQEEIAGIEILDASKHLVGKGLADVVDNQIAYSKLGNNEERNKDLVRISRE